MLNVMHENCGSTFLERIIAVSAHSVNVYNGINFIPQVNTHMVQNGELCLSAHAWVLYPGSGGRLIPTPVPPIRNYDCGIHFSHQQAPPSFLTLIFTTKRHLRIKHGRTGSTQ